MRTVLVAAAGATAAALFATAAPAGAQPEFGTSNLVVPAASIAVDLSGAQVVPGSSRVLTFGGSPLGDDRARGRRW